MEGAGEKGGARGQGCSYSVWDMPGGSQVGNALNSALLVPQLHPTVATFCSNPQQRYILHTISNRKRNYAATESLRCARLGMGGLLVPLPLARWSSTVAGGAAANLPQLHSGRASPPCPPPSLPASPHLGIKPATGQQPNLRSACGKSPRQMQLSTGRPLQLPAASATHSPHADQGRRAPLGRRSCQLLASCGTSWPA